MTIKSIINTMSVANIAPDQFRSIHEEIVDASNSGKTILLERMGEIEFVQLRTAIKAITLASVLDSVGALRAAGLLTAEQSGSLDPMLDTFFVAMYGLLVAEEIV